MTPQPHPGHPRWLSEGAEVLVQEIARAPDDLHCEVLIVGSGYGGAVAAARLAGATPAAGGKAVKVYVLERGNEYLPGMFPATFAELPGHVRFGMQDGQGARGKRDGLFDLRLGGDVNVLLGNGLGGGSLINAAVMEQPSDDAFGDVAWPKGMKATLAGAYDRAERMLGLQQPVDEVPKYVSLQAAAKELGEHARKAAVAIAFVSGENAAGVAVSACLNCGDCVTGCNHQAKQSLDANYLALARANGARLFCGATGMCIRPLADRDGYAVEFRLTDVNRARSDTEPYVVNARRVVLAAGALGSTEILMRSRAALPMAVKALGTRFSGNGDSIAVAHRQNDRAPHCAHEGDVPARRGIGPTITGLFRRATRHQVRPMVFEEFGIPAPLRRLFGEVVATVGALHGLAKMDETSHQSFEKIADPLSIDDEALAHTPVYGMMGDDGAAGLIEWTPGDGRDAHDGQVRIRWPDKSVMHRLFEDQVGALRDAHEAWSGRGGQVLPNPIWHPLPPFEALQGLGLYGGAFSVHPLGGCPMSDDPAAGVVDSFGRLHAADGGAPLTGLAVLDGSIVPASLGINPALTIAALAERALPQLADDWQLVLRAESKAPPRQRPQWRKVEAPSTPQSTVVELKERMTGRLTIDGRVIDAAVTVCFAPFAVNTWRHLPRVVSLPEVHIERLDAGTGATLSVARGHGQATVLGRRSSAPLDRIVHCIELARRKLAPLTSWRQATAAAGGGSVLELMRLCSHLGQQRTIIYDWTIDASADPSLLKPGATLRLEKCLDFTEGGNPWRQLTEGDLTRPDSSHAHLGRLVLDPGYLVEQLTPLLGVRSQQDQPNAIGDIVELSLWVLRIVLRIHLLNFLPPVPAQPGKTDDVLDGVIPQTHDLPVGENGRGQPIICRLSRYAADSVRAELRPVLLIHGYGAAGSTFAHNKIPINLVQVLMRSQRAVWVLDLRSSIALNQHEDWTFDTIADGDIAAAVRCVAQREKASRIDIVAHCVGAAMFSVAVLRDPMLRAQVGRVVLSQVGPLLRMSAFNRFRGFVASYLQRFVAVREFDANIDPDTYAKPGNVLVNGALATFPYPDDDNEAELLKRVPGFDVVRHRADAIYGQTMHLPNIDEGTLPHLGAIYGWVRVKSLAQTIHYARERMLTDPNGSNQVLSLGQLAAGFNFPLLMLHGRRNAIFDWRGSYDTMRLLSQVFAGPELPAQPSLQPIHRAGPSQWLQVFDGYGHQDLLIGKKAHVDVFPRIVEFLDEPSLADPQPKLTAKRFASWPAIGPMLGRVAVTSNDPATLTCHIALRAPPARQDALGVVFVPVTRIGADWDVHWKFAVIQPLAPQELADRPLKVKLLRENLPAFDGFLVATVHDDLPLPRGSIEPGDPLPDAGRLFELPNKVPKEGERDALVELLNNDRAGLELSVVHIDPAWVAAATDDSATALSFALASCQYPAGLVDRLPAQASLRRLADRLAADGLPRRAQLLLLLGDQVYVDDLAGLFNPAAGDEADHAHGMNLALPAFRRVAKALPCYPLLDDHEVVDNWEPADPLSDRETAALESYRRHQHKLVDDTAAPPFDYRIAPAGFLFFLFDARSLRQRRTLLRRVDGAVPVEEASIHGGSGFDDLLAWLLQAPRELPKFIASSVGVFPLQRAALTCGEAERIALDDWSGYPQSLFVLLDFIRSNAIEHVVLLSGDRHLSSVSSLWLDRVNQSALEVVSIVSSGLHAPWPFANSRPEDFVLDGPLTFSHAGATITGTMVTGAVGSSDGFAVVQVDRVDAGWRLSVQLDLADGMRSCSRVLGDQRDIRWQVG